MYEDILQHISRYVTLKPEESAYFTERLRKRILRKRQYLVQAGDVNRNESFVSKGCLRAFYVNQKSEEYIVAGVVMTGTQTEALFDLPPTGRKIRVNQINIEHIRNGKISEHWRGTDELTMMRQLGWVE